MLAYFLCLLITLNQFVHTLSADAKEGLESSICSHNQGIILNNRILLQKLTHFNRERIIERRRVAEGQGALGYFEVTNPLARYYIKGKTFTKLGQKIPLVARFGSEIGHKDSIELKRNSQAFSVKIYTKDEGNWDILTLNRECFDIEDPILFPDLVYSREPDPHSNLNNLSKSYDFMASHPETLCAYMQGKLDEGFPANWRVMTTYSINTFRVTNSVGNFWYARFILRAVEKFNYFEDEQAALVRGFFPDYYSEDLWSAINEGDFPTWYLEAQIVDPKDVKSLDFNPFDATKIWSEDKFTKIVIGKIVLNENLKNFFTQNEVVAFRPTNLVPGIRVTIDKLLQGRAFAYPDAQHYRIGINGDHFAVNKARKEENRNDLRDGLCPPPDNGQTNPDLEKSYAIDESILYQQDAELMSQKMMKIDYYSTPNNTWNEASDEAKKRIAQRIAKDLVLVDSKLVRKRFVKQLANINFEMVEKIMQALQHTKKLNIKDFQPQAKQ